MKDSKRLWVIGPLAALAACATPPPTLLFADNVTFGLQLGTNTTAGGGGVTIGYKNRSVAIVPLSVLDETGQAHALRGGNPRGKDALSVFAVFDASDPNRSSPLRVGQVFSTGTAAQSLTEGYECHLAPKTPLCSVSPEAKAAAVAGAAASAAIASATAASASATTAATAAASAKLSAAAAALVAPPSTQGASPGPQDAAVPVDTSDRPYQWPLVYARTDVIGIDISGSAVDQGVAFTLGYTARNLAVIPAYAQSTKQRVSGLFGVGTDVQDGYSVLGQFNGNTSTSDLAFGIERYFATGVAAQNLARGIGAMVAAKPPPAGASATAK